MRRISFHTLGCKLNFSETSTLGRQFEAAGFVRTRDRGADLCVVNTCSVTEHADKKCRNLIRRLVRENPGAVIVVTGCYAQLQPGAVAAIEGVDLVVGNDDKGRVFERAMALLGDNGMAVCAPATEKKVAADAIGPAEPDTDPANHERYNPRTDTADAPRFLPIGGVTRNISPRPHQFVVHIKNRMHIPYLTTKDTQIGGIARNTLPQQQQFVVPIKKHVRTSHLATYEKGATADACTNGKMHDFFSAFSSGDRTRTFLKVQDGCDYRCSYCTIPRARGASRNPPIADLVAAAREIARGGQREVVLTGVNTGDFGRTTGESFLDLLRALDSVEGIERYRISSIEPNLLTDEIIAFTAASEKFQPHFHIPLQSGCDRILGLMRRRYTTAIFADRIAKVRSTMPDAFIGVDVIVGFPGETYADFEQTVAFLEEVAPAFLHVFPYSARPGTVAAAMPGHVDPRTSAARVKRLTELSDRLHDDFCTRFVGKPLPVLWESTPRAGRMSGFTGNYIRVSAPWDSARVGTIDTVVVPPKEGLLTGL